jgi:hypothetical protein
MADASTASPAAIPISPSLAFMKRLPACLRLNLA